MKLVHNVPFRPPDHPAGYATSHAGLIARARFLFAAPPNVPAACATRLHKVLDAPADTSGTTQKHLAEFVPPNAAATET
ncbi:MAG TPA: hypothetical protein VKP30_14785 [Polyangiaceae bacterium]|nr:hypothetical protein [Polyangiaceae bacterium]